MTSIDLAHKASQLCLDKRAYDVIIVDLRGITTIADCFVICTADSDVQVKAISEYIRDELKKIKIKAWHIEGYKNPRWVLLDFVDVVVHVFQPEIREFYGLERLWGDAPIIEIETDNETKGLHTKDS
jgi:ribosome-associated protein